MFWSVFSCLVQDDFDRTQLQTLILQRISNILGCTVVQSSGHLYGCRKWQTVAFEWALIACPYFTVKAADFGMNGLSRLVERSPLNPHFFFYHISKWNQSRESVSGNEMAERRSVREVTASYFFMRWSSDISALRGCLSTGRISAAGSCITSCSRVLHGCRMQTSWCWSMDLHINQRQKGICSRIWLCDISFRTCVWSIMCCWRLATLLYASWWEVTWQTIPCDLYVRPHHSSENAV